MYPLPFFHLFGYPISLYTLFYGLGFVPVIWLALHLARRRGYPLRPFVDGAILSLIAALLGGPLIVLLLRALTPRMGYFNTLPINWSFAQVIAVLLIVRVYNKFSKTTLPFMESLDVLSPSAALYIVLARLGCFFNGCCHGKPAWNLPWAVSFSPYAADTLYPGIPVHPTQLYEAAGCLLIFALLMFLYRRPAWRGRLIGVFLASYGLIRFVIEFYRGDTKPRTGPLSLAQIVCIALMLGGSAGLMGAFRRRVRRLPEQQA